MTCGWGLISRRIAAAVCAVSLVVTTTPVAVAQDRPLARSGAVRLVAPDVVGGWCKETATVRAMTPTEPSYSADDPVSQAITRALSGSMPFECANARAVRIEGVAEGGATFVAAAEAGAGWRLMPPGAEGGGPVRARFNEDGFMPTHWAGTVSLHIQDITRDAIREHDRTERGGLYPQPDGRIRVSLGQCDGQLALVTREEMRASNIRIGTEERLYKIVQPRYPFEAGGATRNANCATSPTVSNWLVLSTRPDTSILVRAIVRNTVDGPRRDNITIETVMGSLAPVYPPRPQTIAEAHASAPDDGPNMVAAGLLLLFGLAAVSTFAGGGFGGGGGGGGGGSNHGDYEDTYDINELGRYRPPVYNDPPAPVAPIAPLYACSDGSPSC